MDFVFIAKRCFKQWVATITFSPPRNTSFSHDIKRGGRKREVDELRQSYLQEKGFTVIEMWECEWWRLHKTTTNVKEGVRGKFFYRRSQTDYQVLKQIKNRKMFGWVQCYIEVPEFLREFFGNFLRISRNTLVSRNDIGDLMKDYAKKAKEDCLKLGKFWYQASQCIMKLWFSSVVVLLASRAFSCKNTILLSTLQKEISTAFEGQQWTQEKKLTRIQSPMKSQRQWNSWPKTPMANTF